MSNPQFSSPTSLGAGALPSTEANNLNGGFNGIAPMSGGNPPMPSPASVPELGVGGFNGPAKTGQDRITDPNAAGSSIVPSPSFGPAALLYPSMSPFPLSSQTFGGNGSDSDY